MDEVLYPDIFYEYKEGFANGIIDLIIKLNNGVDSTSELQYNSFWDLGYSDAYNYYSHQLLESNNKKIELSNIFLIINEFYIKRIEQYNQITKDEIPAFVLLLKRNKIK